MLITETIIGSIKNQQNPLIFRKQQLKSLLSSHLPNKQKIVYNIYIQNTHIDDDINQIPLVLQSLFSYSKFQLANDVVSNNHIVSILFLQNLQKYNYLNYQQQQQITNKLVDLIVRLECSEQVFDIQCQFILLSVRWINNMLLKRKVIVNNQIIDGILTKKSIQLKQFQTILSKKSNFQDRILNKILFFIKINGLNSNTSQIFQEYIKLIQITYYKMQIISKELNTKVIITNSQTNMIQFYELLDKLNYETRSNKIHELLKIVIDRLNNVMDDQGILSHQFIKMQRIIQQCYNQNTLFKLLKQNLDQQIVQLIYQLMAICVINSYWSSKNIIKYFQEYQVSIDSYDWGQYNVISKIAQNQLFMQPEHYSFIDRILANKRYLPQSDNIGFIQTLLFLTKNSLNKNKVIKLINGSASLRLFLNVPPNKKFTSSNIEYITKCIKFLNNLNYTEYSKQLSEYISEIFDLNQLLSLIKNHGFYLEPSKETYSQYILQTQIFKLIYEYNLYQTIKQQQLTKILIQSLQSHLKIFRSYSNNNHENVLFFIEEQQIDINTNDIIYYCSQFIYILLIMSIRQMNELIVQEMNKLSLKKLSLLICSQITTILQTYMFQKEYNSRKSIVNKLLKLLQKQFSLELQLKYYYNYNNQVKEQTKSISQQNIFKKQKSYMNQYPANKIILQFILSKQFQQIFQQEQSKGLQKLNVLITKNEKNFINHLLFILNKNDINQNHERICKLLIKLLRINKSFAEIFVQFRFVQIFYSLFKQQSPYINQLLLICHQLIQGESKEVNKAIQQKFQQGIQQDSNNEIIRMMKKYVWELLEVQKTEQPIIKEVEKHIKYKIKYPLITEFSPGMLILILIQYMCQSLNLGIKSKFGCMEDKLESILSILINLIKTLVEQNGIMSRYKATILIQSIKTLSTLIRGPHQKNIQRALHQGYHKLLLSIVLIPDDFNTIIQKINKSDVKEQIISRSYYNFLFQGNENFCSYLLKPQITLREPIFDIKQISELKRLVLSQTIIIMDFFNKNTLKMFYDISKKLLIQFMQKAYKVYGYEQKDLQKLIVSKNVNNTFDQILSFDIADLLFKQQQINKQHQAVKDSLLLEIGNNLFIIMSKYEQKQGLQPIKQSVHKYLSSLRLKRRYNQKAGILYQLYILFKDIFTGIVGAIMRSCRFGNFAYEGRDHILETDEDKYKKSIDFFAKNISKIEVCIEGKDTFVSFPLLIQDRCITKSIKRDLSRNIDYSTTTQGHRTFMNRMEIILLRLKQQRKLSQLMIKNKMLGVIIKNRQLWKNLSFFSAVLQNVVLLAKTRISYEFYISASFLMRAIQYTLAILLFVLLIFESFGIRKMLGQRELNRKEVKNKYKYWIKLTWFIITDKTLLFVVYYVLFTSLGIKWDVAVSLLLLDFFYRFKATRFLQNMVVDVWPSLLTNIFFFMIILYLVTLILGNHKTQDFFGMNCETYASCMQMAFYSLQKIQPEINDNMAKSFSLGGVGVITTSITIFLLLSFRGLFFGIMIDQKRKVRKQKQQLTKLIVNKCFICGETRADINRKQGMQKGFKKHIQLYHNIWNYVYYLSYVSQLPAEQITIQQHFILKQLKNKSYNWIPAKKS